MSAVSTEGAPRAQGALFMTIMTLGVAAAIGLAVFGGSLQPLGSPQAAPPVVETPAAEEPSEPTAEEPAPVSEPDPSTEPTPEPEVPAEPVDLGTPTSELGLALVAEFGPETTFWRNGEQVRDPQKGDIFRAPYLATTYVGELVQWWVGTDDYWLFVEGNSEAEGLTVLIKL